MIVSPPSAVRKFTIRLQRQLDPGLSLFYNAEYVHEHSRLAGFGATTAETARQLMRLTGSEHKCQPLPDLAEDSLGSPLLSVPVSPQSSATNVPADQYI
ncbi:hypothetical protein ElyMa_002169800 [Elysia marginata]|uniref:Uncharacterized protein n=1 Tax=Elysia marginata TaxID=1093978 RepID=A0AAV4FMI9_9GAST|nr:hypothetical protein ElyMa_002169800 [Elysia marginata]